MAKSKRQQEREEKKKAQREASKRALDGIGLYRFRNHSRADLILPKPTNNGRKIIGPGKEFEGDSYFLKLVKTHQLMLVEVLDTGVEKMNEETLILDQPQTFTTKGAVEHVVQPQSKPLTEQAPQDEQPVEDSLINEDPVDLDGVQIITD
jgi:hypothetical protein